VLVALLEQVEHALPTTRSFAALLAVPDAQLRDQFRLGTSAATLDHYARSARHCLPVEILAAIGSSADYAAKFRHKRT
jgi:hypothetical protein